MKLLQLARSTPYVICALVGHKSSEHVGDNLHLSQVITGPYTMEQAVVDSRRDILSF